MRYNHAIRVTRINNTITLHSGDYRFHVDAVDQLEALIAELQDVQGAVGGTR